MGAGFAAGGTGRPMKGPSIAAAPQVPGARAIIAVASGKGGVGKSTCATEIALALQRRGTTTGILDGDVCGPTVPSLLGLEGRADVREDGKLVPRVSQGVQCMSIGLLVDPEKATVWRGPMVMSALDQMIRKTAWDVDVLVVDLPPGTGDAHLTLCQNTPLAGALIVSTPSKAASSAVRKGINMFHKLNVPVLGVV